jgi:hypothetical protein
MTDFLRFDPLSRTVHDRTALLRPGINGATRPETAGELGLMPGIAPPLLPGLAQRRVAFA